jgi:hypothetical protein
VTLLVVAVIAFCLGVVVGLVGLAIFAMWAMPPKPRAMREWSEG